MTFKLDRNDKERYRPRDNKEMLGHIKKTFKRTADLITYFREAGYY